MVSFKVNEKQKTKTAITAMISKINDFPERKLQAAPVLLMLVSERIPGITEMSLPVGIFKRIHDFET